VAVDVFLSYQRADTTIAAHLLRYAVRGAGHGVFLDTGDIAAGAAFRDVIATALERAGLVLALVGPAFDVGKLASPLDPVAFEWRQARFLGCRVHGVLVAGARMPAEADLPADLRWFTKASATSLPLDGLGGRVEELVAALPTLAGAPRGRARVLWVDDRPANNEQERALLRRDGIVFDNVVSTAEAIAQLQGATYDLVITDLGRAGSSDLSSVAGAELLAHPVIASGGPPVIVYGGPGVDRWAERLTSAGAFGVTASRARLLQLARQALGRAPAEQPPSGS
jgi:CheY-like chemotaxis protein